MHSFKNKRVLITGAARGLGKALGVLMAQHGAEVILTDRDGAEVATLTQTLIQKGLAARAFPLDVTDPDTIISFRDMIQATIGPIDILINNAGIVVGGPFLDVSRESHQKTFAVNLSGVVDLCHAFLPGLLTRWESHLVNIASASAFIPLPWGTTYAASKWAVLGFTDSLREELKVLGHRQIGVTSICPSYIDSGMFQGVRLPWLTRWLSVDFVADAVLKAIRTKQATVILPWSVRLLLGVSGLVPREWFHRACQLLGVQQSMQNWKGH